MRIAHYESGVLQINFKQAEAAAIKELGPFNLRPQLAEKKLVLTFDPTGKVITSLRNTPNLRFNGKTPDLPLFGSTQTTFTITNGVFKGVIIDIPDVLNPINLPSKTKTFSPAPTTAIDLLRALDQLIQSHGYTPAIEDNKVVLYQQLRIAA